jgi:hypothetical protein
VSFDRLTLPFRVLGFYGSFLVTTAVAEVGGLYVYLTRVDGRSTVESVAGRAASGEVGSLARDRPDLLAVVVTLAVLAALFSRRVSSPGTGGDLEDAGGFGGSGDG